MQYVKNYFKSGVHFCSILCMLLLCSSRALAKDPVIVINSAYRLILDADKGTIESFRATSGGGDNELLIPSHDALPMFKIEFLIAPGQFQTITSLEAEKVSVKKSVQNGEEILLIDFNNIGKFKINARVRIRCPFDKPLTYWSLQLDNPTNMWIGHIQFPVVKVPFDKNPTEENCGHILYSIADGVLTSPVTPSMVVGGWKTTKYDDAVTWRSPNYPREYTTQMMAYYTNSAGLYLACEDPTGIPKLISPLISNDGVTMGLGHYPGTKGPGKMTLPYEVVMGAFRGDWYQAANIYRNWAEKQPFCAQKVTDKKNFPKWLLKPIVGMAFPMRGQGDWDPPAAINTEYSPATNALPYLDKLAKAVDAPLMPIVFNWEHGGPWVQPEAFPPVGGDVAMRSFMKQSKTKGWHPVLYGDALNWVVKQKNTGYDGMPYFKSKGAENAVCKNWDGSISLYPGCRGARSFYATCVATKPSRDMVLDMTRNMAQLGPDVIQQFDQLAGATPCYATDHGHPPVPGEWMTKDFTSLLRQDNELARSINPSVVMACEGAPAEVYMQDFELWDARTGGAGQMMCPLFQFLYHEYLVGHSGFLTNSVNDEALRASVARAFVSGYFLNFTLRDKGQIEYDWDETWDRAVPDQVAILDWAKRATAFRNNVGRDFLVYGKMLIPWKVSNVIERDFGHGKEPLVQSTTWKATDGRIGVALANYGDVRQMPSVELEGKGKKKIDLYIDDKVQHLEMDLPAVLNVDMPSRSVGLIVIQ